MNQLSNITWKNYRLKAHNIGRHGMETKLLHILTCSRVITDAQTRLPSYIEVFNTITIPKNLGFWYQTFFVAGTLNNDFKGYAKGAITISGPDGFNRSSPLEGEVSPGYVPFNAMFDSVKFEKAGKYLITMKFQDKELVTEEKYIQVVLESYEH